MTADPRITMPWPVAPGEQPLVQSQFVIVNAFDGRNVEVGGTFVMPGGGPAACRTGRLVAVYQPRQVMMPETKLDMVVCDGRLMTVPVYVGSTPRVVIPAYISQCGAKPHRQLIGLNHRRVLGFPVIIGIIPT